jgi:hypothetical protein
MKKLMLSALIALTASATPALAQDRWHGGDRYGDGYEDGYRGDGDGYRGYNDGFGGYGNYDARVHRVGARVLRAYKAGYLDRGEYYNLAVGQRRLESVLRRYRYGGLNDWERRDLDQRMAAMEERLDYASRDGGRRYSSREYRGY